MEVPRISILSQHTSAGWLVPPGLPPAPVRSPEVLACSSVPSQKAGRLRERTGSGQGQGTDQVTDSFCLSPPPLVAAEVQHECGHPGAGRQRSHGGGAPEPGGDAARELLPAGDGTVALLPAPTPAPGLSTPPRMGQRPPPWPRPASSFLRWARRPLSSRGDFSEEGRASEAGQGVVFPVAQRNQFCLDLISPSAESL